MCSAIRHDNGSIIQAVLGKHKICPGAVVPSSKSASIAKTLNIEFRHEIPIINADKISGKEAHQIEGYVEQLLCHSNDLLS